MKSEPLAPEDRAYLREAVASVAGRRWMNQLIAMRPPISGKTGEERAIAASEAMGYEQAVSNMGLLLEDPRTAPEIKSIPIAED
jgi:hypothetical protein